MRLTGSRTYYRPSPPKMPPGLVELMEGLTREVLKHNPSDVYGFCASHMHQLLEKRDGPSVKKSLPLEEKIARVQEKVRLKAEIRRQEYDKNVMLLQKNGNAINNEVKDLTEQVPHTAAAVHDPVSIVLNKDTIESSVHDDPQNSTKRPVHQEQALENSGEMEISQSGLKVSKPEVNVTKSNDDEKGYMKTNDKPEDNGTKSTHDEKGNMKTIDIIDEKKIENVAATQSDYEPIVNIIGNDISSHTEPRTETVNKELTSDIIPDTSKSSDVKDRRNENQQDGLINNDVPLDFVNTTIKTEEKVENNAEVIAVEYGTVNKTVEIVDNLSESSADENAKIEVVQSSSQAGDLRDSVELNNVEQFHYNAKNELSTRIEDVQSIDVANSDTASDIPKTDSDKDVQNLKNASNPDTANDIPKTDSDKDVQNLNDAANSDTASDIPKTDSDKDVQNLNNTSNSDTANDILKTDSDKDVQNLNDPPNSDTASDIPKTDSDEDVQNLNDTPNTHQSDNTYSNDFLPENSSKATPMPSSEKDTQLKGNDNLPTVDSTTNNDICNKQENIENTSLGLHDITKIKMPNLETGVEFDFQTTGVDGDIPTLVTENSGNDTHEIKVSENNTLQTATSLENMSEVYKENVNDVDNTDNISTRKTDSNNVDTTEGEILSNVNEINAEKHGTNPMDLETAAVTIQKVFRNFLFKSRGSTFEDTTNEEGNFLDEDDKNKEECDFSIASALNIDRRAHGITRMDTVLQTVNEEKSLSLSTDDSSTLSSAATIIQAHVRGFLVRNKMNSNKTMSSNSLAASNSNEPSITSIEANNGSGQNKNKTILNIHIVPEGENYLSRDESLITSMDLSLDSPPSSINLHPLGYDKSERRKQLKREDAIQSISPPSNNSGKLSEDFDSVKELPLNNEHDIVGHTLGDNITANGHLGMKMAENDHIQTPVENGSLEIILKGNDIVNTNENNTNDPETHLKKKRQSLSKNSSDEMDVVTPYLSQEDLTSSNLMHSGEFHDAVLPTRVLRSDTSVVSEFKNVLVYFLLWNHTC